MFHRYAIVALVLSAAAVAACSDSVGPVGQRVVPVSALHDRLKRGQCFFQIGVEGTQVGPNADGNAMATAPDGDVVTQVAVKAGIACWFTPAGATGSYTITVDDSPCYVVAGLGDATATITRIGTGPSCKDISHVELVSAPRRTTGTLRICPVLVGTLPPDQQQGIIPFVVAGQQITVMTGTCADATELAGVVTIAEQTSGFGFGLIGAVTAPSDRLVGFDVAAQTVTVNIVAGSTTIVTIPNTLVPDPGKDEAIRPGTDLELRRAVQRQTARSGPERSQ